MRIKKPDPFGMTKKRPLDLFDKQRERWTKEDYRIALGQLTDKKLNFSILMLTRRTMVSPAFLELSPRATKLLLCAMNNTWVAESYKDRRNTNKHTEGIASVIETEEFVCPYSLAEAFGVGSRKQIKEAFAELKALGFIEQIGVRKPNAMNVYIHSQDHLKLNYEQVAEIKQGLKKPKK